MTKFYDFIYVAENYMKMHKNGAMLTLACVMLCLTFNYTFPLRRESSKWNIFGNRNDSQHYCDKNHHVNMANPRKNMHAAHPENALKIIKDSGVNENRKRKTQTKCPLIKNTDDDLRHFEQLVIKKKNPYLDLKELELKYYNPKNTRQSINPGPIGQDLSLCEPLEDGLNVEITNRGLSGFAIPTKLKKGPNVAENKIELENPAVNDKSGIKTIYKDSIKKSDRFISDLQLLNTLEDDIRHYEERKDSETL